MPALFYGLLANQPPFTIKFIKRLLARPCPGRGRPGLFLPYFPEQG
jgi:hypothetical protein